MKGMIWICALSLTVAASAQAADRISGGGAEAPRPSVISQKAKNIIFMVPDGMGLANVTAARIFKNGPGGDMLNLERPAFIGYQRNWSADSTITDSAAAASTWACGEKFNNYVICVRPDGTHPANLLEVARAKGKAAGLVATATISHATPAAFGSHVLDRNCENEIARQYLFETQIEVLLGGGAQRFNSTRPDACNVKGNWIPGAEAAGYRVVSSREEMREAQEDGVRKILGLFSEFEMTPEYLRDPSTPEPRLPEMAAAALDILEEDPDGFFLLIEGSQVDWANHDNNFDYQLGEVLAFDEAAGVVQDWIKNDPRREAQTLLIIVADHETGGYAINGPYGELSQPGDKVWAGWTSGSHTGVDTMIWSQGPGAWRLGRPIDNTFIYKVMVDVLQ